MEIALKAAGTSIVQLNNNSETHSFLRTPISRPSFVSPVKSVLKPVMASLRAVSTTTTTVGLSKTFHNLKQQGKVAFIPYITAGDPDLSTTAKALKVLDSCGSDIIELGVPYSHPFMDGPVIKAAASRSLANGTNFHAIVSMLKEVRSVAPKVVPQLSCPIALFTYYNPILNQGVDKFMTTVKDAGVHGLIVPDVPLEKTKILGDEAAKNDIEHVLLTTPTTPKESMKTIVDASQGFVYLVAATGVTGARPFVSPKVQGLLKDVKEETSKPVAVGFGISKPEHVKQVAGWGADGVIVGSAIVRILGEAKSAEEGIKQLEIFTNSLKSALP